jgi:triphosphatase
VRAAESKRGGGSHLNLREAGVSLHAQQTVGDAVRVILLRQFSQFPARRPGTQFGQDPDAVHDLRVAVRRMRAAARLFKDGLQPRERDHLRMELSWLADVLGAVRDRDVQLERLEHYRRALPPEERSALAGLQAHLRAERAQHRAALLAAFDSTRYAQLLARIARLAPRRPMRAIVGGPPLPRAGRRAVKRAAQRVLQRGREIDAHPGPPAAEKLHSLRRRAKALRYVLEFLSELTGKPGKRLVKDAVQLQELLGTYHDAVVTADMARRYAEGPGAHADPRTLLALGAMIGDERCHAETARGQFRQAWHQFARKSRRDLRRVKRRLRTINPSRGKRAATAPADAGAAA